MAPPRPSVPSAARASRIRALQEVEGLTQADLAAIMGVSQPYVSAILQRRRPMPAHAVEALQLHFSLPASFFTIDDGVLEDVTPTFRKKSGASAKAERRLVRLVREAARLWTGTATNTGLPPAPVLDIEPVDDIESAAAAARRKAGIGEKAPVANMTRAAERLGIAVIRHLDPEHRELGHGQHEGISLPSARSTHPLVALASPVSPDRTRLTIAHEIGHLVYDRDREVVAESSKSPEELRAFEFAAAFLVPATELESTVGETTSLADFARLKAAWGLSVGALIKRSRKLGLISASRERSLWIQYSSRGWRKGEPVAVPEERPLLLGQAVARAWPHDGETAAPRTTGIPWRWIETWTENETQRQPDTNQALLSLDRYREQRAVRR